MPTLREAGDGEMGTLARAINHMAQALDERVEALQRSKACVHAAIAGLHLQR